MKTEIIVIGNDNVKRINRVVKDGVVTYGKRKYFVEETGGSYRIDLDNPIESDIVFFDDNEVLKRAQEILVSRSRVRETFFNSGSEAKQFFTLRHEGLLSEVFDVAYLDHKNCLIEVVRESTGGLSSASVHPRNIVRNVIKYNASTLILGHNHPSMSLEPSHADIRITQKLSQAVTLVESSVIDHIITGGHAAISLAERGEI